MKENAETFLGLGGWQTNSEVQEWLSPLVIPSLIPLSEGTDMNGINKLFYPQEIEYFQFLTAVQKQMKDNKLS